MEDLQKLSEAIDLGNNSLISARVLEYKPSAVRPLDEVRPQIAQLLQRKLAGELAAKSGAEKLALLSAGKDAGVTFGAAQKLTRQAPLPNVNQALVKVVFAADVSKGSATVGGSNDAGGYTVAKVVKIIEPEAASAEKLKSVSQRLTGQGGVDLANAYLVALKERIKVEIKSGALPVAPAKSDKADKSDKAADGKAG